jgi:hypothetical protein
MIGIYKITSPSGKIYIGKTKHFEKRIKQYKGLKEKDQRKLFYSFQKYGYIKINEELDFYEIWFKDKENKLYLELLNSNLNFEFSKHSENITKTKIYKSNIYK